MLTRMSRCRLVDEDEPMSLSGCKLTDAVVDVDVSSGMPEMSHRGKTMVYRQRSRHTRRQEMHCYYGHLSLLWL
jgi:hypothetical protein